MLFVYRCEWFSYSIDGSYIIWLFRGKYLPTTQTIIKNAWKGRKSLIKNKFAEKKYFFLWDGEKPILICNYHRFIQQKISTYNHSDILLEVGKRHDKIRYFNIFKACRGACHCAIFSQTLSLFFYKKNLLNLLALADIQQPNWRNKMAVIEYMWYFCHHNETTR